MIFDDVLASPVAIKMRAIKFSLSRTPNLDRVVYVFQKGGSTSFGTFMIYSILAFASLLTCSSSKSYHARRLSSYR